MPIKGIIESEQPREKAMLYGIECLSNEELLAILLRCGSKKESAIALSKQILNKVNGISNLMNITLYDLMSIEGIKKAKALTILSALELNKRIRSVQFEEGITLHSSREAYDYVRSKLEYETQEKVLVLFMNVRGQLLKEKVVFVGSLTMSVISPKEIFKEALLCNSVGLFIFHNHPSGNSLPSSEDIEITKKIVMAALCFDIHVIDHIVVGKNEYYSFLEHGII